MKVVINRCYGGFSLSKAAYNYLGLEWDGFGFAYRYDRTNPKLIECLETIGCEVASGGLADLKIVEIPDDVKWELEEYDGIEWISELPQIWS